MKRSLKLFVLIGVFQHSLLAQDLRKLHINQEHINLSLELDTIQSAIRGKVTLFFKVLPTVCDSFWIDGIRLQIDTILLNHSIAKFKQTDQGLWIHNAICDTSIKQKLHLVYSCKPRKGLYFHGFNQDNGHKQIWSQGQGIDHRHWIPHQDDQRDKLTHTIRLTTPKNWMAVSNGDLIRKEEKVNSITWLYNMTQAHSSYLIMLAAGRFHSFLEKDSTERPYETYLSHKQKHTYEYNFKRMPFLLQWMEAEIGSTFPWKAPYKQVVVSNFKHGAMENTCAVLIGDIFLQDSLIPWAERTALEIQAHELAHHWFGNWVTASSTENHWLHEGFATFWQWQSKLAFEDTFSFQLARNQAAERIFNQSINKPTSIKDPNVGSIGFYDKGGWVVSMLRDYIGNHAWTLGVDHWLRTYAQGISDDSQLQQSLQLYSNKDLRPFFDFWVRSGGEPEVNIHIETKGTTNLICLKSNVAFAAQLSLLFIWDDGQTEIQTFDWLGKEMKLPIKIRKGHKLLGVIPDPQKRLLIRWNFPIPDNLLTNFNNIKTTIAWKHWLKQSKEDYTFKDLHILTNLTSKNIELALALWQNSEIDTLLKSKLFEDWLENPRFFHLTEYLAPDILQLPEISENAIEALLKHKTYVSQLAVLEWFVKYHPTKFEEFSNQLLETQEPAIQRLTAKNQLYRFLILNDEKALLSLEVLASGNNEFVGREMAIQYLILLNHLSKKVFSDALKDYFHPNNRVAAPARQYINHWVHKKNKQEVWQPWLEELKPNWNSQQWQDFNKMTGN